MNFEVKPRCKSRLYNLLTMYVTLGLVQEQHVHRHREVKTEGTSKSIIKAATKGSYTQVAGEVRWKRYEGSLYARLSSLDLMLQSSGS